MIKRLLFLRYGLPMIRRLLRRFTGGGRRY